jgi:hypothetical protein
MGFFPQLVLVQKFPVVQSALVAQVLLHVMLVPHRNGAHGCVVPATHVPVPLHSEASFCVDPVHEPAAHEVPLAYKRQAPAPLHDPSVPHEEAPRSAHWLSGSWPAGTFEQTPAVPARLHAWHGPGQALSQQRPCSQAPVAHSAALAHAAPPLFFMHVPPMQESFIAQSVATAHVVVQAVGPQMNGVHACTAPGTQTPAPSHFAVARSEAAVHVGGEQVVPDRYLRQAPAPSHVPSSPQVSEPLSAHWPSGSCPAGMVEQVPAVPARLHDWQIPLHAVVQHAPSSQKPELHSSAVVHAPPSGFLPQLELMQVFGAAQSASFAQTVWQTAFAPQMKGAQLWVAGVGHVPVASQRDARVIVEPVHEA